MMKFLMMLVLLVVLVTSPNYSGYKSNNGLVPIVDQYPPAPKGQYKYCYPTAHGSPICSYNRCPPPDFQHSNAWINQQCGY